LIIHIYVFLHIFSKENEIVSVWGGVLEDLYAQHIENDDSLYKRQTRHRIIHRMDIPSCVAVLITGSIQTWSIILQNRTKEQAEAKLKLFKNEVKLKKHSIGFMFMCIARGNEMYNETNVESTIFKRLFPKIPLVGCSGYGEFGKSTIVDEVNKESKLFLSFVNKNIFLMKISRHISFFCFRKHRGM